MINLNYKMNITSPLKLGMIAMLYLTTMALVHSQTTTDRWAVSISANAINHFSVYEENFDGFTEEKYNDYINPGIAIYKLFGRRWIGDLTFFGGNVTNKLLNFPIDEPFYTTELGMSFRPKAKVGIIDPYLRLGLGYHHYDYVDLQVGLNSDGEPVIAGKEFIQGSAGLGINFWVFDKVGFKVASNYNYLPLLEGNDKDLKGYIDYFNSSFAIIARFGGPYKVKSGIMPLDSDRDQDGILDEEDTCPTDYGYEHLQGCPDKDLDGTKDSEDLCPKEHGSIENGGCPKVEVDTIAIGEVREMFKWVDFRFEINTAKLTEESKTNAKFLAKIINKYEDKRFYIDGHADITGKAERNKVLSKERAQSVVDALVNAGVPKNRLDARGFGYTQPLAPNDTPEGRKQNRRVEINLIPDEPEPINDLSK